MKLRRILLVVFCSGSASSFRPPGIRVRPESTEDEAVKIKRVLLTSPVRPRNNRCAVCDKAWITIAALCLLVVFALAACTSEQGSSKSRLTVPPDTKRDAPTTEATPDVAETRSGSHPIAVLAIAKVRRHALEDGRIDRREAIRLAIGVRKDRFTRIQAVLTSRGDRSVWMVSLGKNDGCHYVSEIDARTGKGGDIGGGCP